MIKDNIFLEDVEVPEIVQQKADKAFFAIQAERSFLMNDMVKKNRAKEKVRNVFSKKIAFAAACMAVIVAAGALAGSVKGILEHSKSGSEDALLAAVDQIDKLFTLQVKAAGAVDGQMVPLAEGNPIPVTINNEKTGAWVFGADGSIVDYCIHIPQIVCEGDQIESITYSINNGAFQIVQPEGGESIISDGQLYNGELNTGSIGGDYEDAENAKSVDNDGQLYNGESDTGSIEIDEKGTKEGLPSRPFETLFYKSFTLNYDRQFDAYTWINICNERSDSEEIVQLIWNKEGSEEKYSSGVQKMLDNTVITCTVNYKDNTSQSADIKVDSHVMTRREAGEPLDEGIDPEEEMTVITFELVTVQPSAS